MMMTQPQLGQGSENRVLAQRLFLRLYQTVNISLRAVSRVLIGVGMSPQQWSILDSLSRPDLVEGMTVNGLVEYLMVSRQSLNGVLKRMEDLNYIERVINPNDRRSRKIRLTKHGREVWGKACDETQQFYQESLKHMSEEEINASIAAFEQIQANVKAL